MLKWAWEKKREGEKGYRPRKKADVCGYGATKAIPPPSSIRRTAPFLFPTFEERGQEKTFFTKLLRLHLFFTET